MDGRVSEPTIRERIRTIQADLRDGALTPDMARESLVVLTALCECGCGEPAPIAAQAQNGYRKGEPQRFILGHGARVQKARTGWHWTDDQRQQLSRAHIGKTPWNAGMKCPQQSGALNHRWTGGRGACADCDVPLKSYIAKRCKSCAMKIATKGRRPSQASLDALRLARVGQPGPFRGQKRPEISGPKCHLWRGGVTTEHERIRKSVEYKAWRRAVFERDGFRCVGCGAVGGRLNADHIKSFARFPALRFDVSNGRTLCVPCHKKTDSYLNRWHVA